MKTKYAKKITKREHIFLGIATLMFLGGLLWLVNDGWNRLFWVVCPLVSVIVFYKTPVAWISERDILDTKDYFIDIHTILTIEKEDVKGNVGITFPHFDDVRTTSVLIHDKDKDRFIADLLSLNPRIELKQQLSYNA
jgi:hypothetical protein